MTTAGRVLEYAVFLAVAAGLAGIVAVVGAGWWQEMSASQAWWMGCGVSLTASALAALMLPLMRGKRWKATLGLGVMLGRLALLVLLGAGALVVGEVAPRPFLLAVAASYLPLLVVDTAYSLRVSERL